MLWLLLLFQTSNRLCHHSLIEQLLTDEFEVTQSVHQYYQQYDEWCEKEDALSASIQELIGEHDRSEPILSLEQTQEAKTDWIEVARFVYTVQLRAKIVYACNCFSLFF